MGGTAQGGLGASRKELELKDTLRDMDHRLDRIEKMLKELVHPQSKRPPEQ